jgi:hypothetical protein
MDQPDSAGWNVLQGFTENSAKEGVTGATIGGGGRPGNANHVSADFGTVGGGIENEASGYAVVAGGSYNTARAFRATVGGGSRNTASTEHATVGGGSHNTADATRATVGGGYGNVASHIDAVVGGGGGNTASGKHATVSGGSQNNASGFDATVGGGSYNAATSTHTTVGGGSENTAAGFDATVGGGAGNSAGGNSTTVSGGLNNRAIDHYGTISGGRGNLAGSENSDPRDTPYATVGGGLDNTASGPFSTIPGGALNEAAAGYSFAAGRRALVHPDHLGTFLYADSRDIPFSSSAPDEFAVRASGGVRLVTAVDSQGVPIAGVTLAAGSGSWATLSDRTAKANIVPVESTEILNRLADLAIFTWNYTSQDASIRHIGPMAQDFYALFALGEDHQHINTVDADGVALAAIQGLSQIVQEQETQIQEQEAQIKTLTARVASLEQQTNRELAPTAASSVSTIWPLLVTVFILGLVLKQRWNN